MRRAMPIAGRGSGPIAVWARCVPDAHGRAALRLGSGAFKRYTPREATGGQSSRTDREGAGGSIGRAAATDQRARGGRAAWASARLD